MKFIRHLIVRPIEVVMVFLLSGMALMVFGNVVLRYGFNTGIVWSEELSRYFFVWLTFIGCVIAFYENAHLGVETFVKVLSRKGRLVCMFMSNFVIVVCCAVFFWGAWQQIGVNASSTAPVVGISMLWVYGVGFFASIGIGLIAAFRALRVLAGRVRNDEIAAFAGEAVAANQAREHAQ